MWTRQLNLRDPVLYIALVLFFLQCARAAQQDGEILEAVEKGAYLNKADFLRVAVRAELSKIRKGE